jgi:hypothetical protein
MTAEPCKRCGKPSVEWVSFASKYKLTKVHLCTECFKLCRETFVKFIFSRDEETSA